MKTLDSKHEHEAHLLRLKYQGFTIVPNAIPPPLLAALRSRFDELVANAANEPMAVVDDASGIVNLNRMYELDSVFEELMMLPSVYPILRDAMAGDVTIGGGAIGQFVPAHTASSMKWHRDGDYMRLTYILSDLPANGGGTALVPGTHRDEEPLPSWCNDDDGATAIPGMVTLAAPAGSCMINDTKLWHTRTANRSEQPRRNIWQVYQRAAQPLTHHKHLRLSEAYIARQTDPERRKLLGLAS